MSNTRVVNIKHEPCEVYIGRAVPRRGLKASPFANPFRIGPDGNRAQVIAKYRAWLGSQPDLMDRAKEELTGRVIGCWCKEPGKEVACHGDVLASLCDFQTDPFEVTVDYLLEKNADLYQRLARSGGEGGAGDE